MRTRGLCVLVCGALAAATATVAATASRDQAPTRDLRSAGLRFYEPPTARQPKNVILLIGDGMGVSEITAARYYQYGADGRMNIDRLSYTGFVTTASLKPAASPPYLPDYVPDSAATGTAWATGNRTIDDRISQGPSAALDEPGPNNGYETLLERAQRRGQRVGLVTTAELTDATPAVMAAHISNRACQGPSDTATRCPRETKSAGGLGSIAEQEIDHGVDVLLGGGRARFAQPTASGRTVIDEARDRGYTIVADSTELAETGPRYRPLLGLFAEGNMTPEWTGPSATTGVGNTPPVRCDTANRPAAQPSLAAMTEKALDLLRNRRGFFVQVEGASIDKQDHAANACGQIGETVAFDEAIGVALRFQRRHPDTLVLVTADHSHTSQIVPEDASGGSAPTGYSINLLTRDGQTLRITYGTSGYGGAGNPPLAVPPSQQHTGAAVPVFAEGPNARSVLGTHPQTDLFWIIQGRRR